MKFFIDTAKVEDIKKANDMGVICGVTTNPSLIAKEGRDFKEVISEITSIVDGPISGDDEALELADRAQGFFLFAGRQLLADLGVVVVRVENTQSRSAFDTDETDRRYGFDVLFRYEREDKRAVPAISKPPITFTKEE